MGYAWFQGLLFGIVPAANRWIKYHSVIVCAIIWCVGGQSLRVFKIVGFNLCFTFPSVAIVIACYRVSVHF